MPRLARAFPDTRRCGGRGTRECGAHNRAAAPPESAPRVPVANGLPQRRVPFGARVPRPSRGAHALRQPIVGASRSDERAGRGRGYASARRDRGRGAAATAAEATRVAWLTVAPGLGALFQRWAATGAVTGVKRYAVCDLFDQLGGKACREGPRQPRAGTAGVTAEDRSRARRSFSEFRAPRHHW